MLHTSYLRAQSITGIERDTAYYLAQIQKNTESINQLSVRVKGNSDLINNFVQTQNIWNTDASTKINEIANGINKLLQEKENDKNSNKERNLTISLQNLTECIEKFIEIEEPDEKAKEDFKQCQKYAGWFSNESSLSDN